MATETAAAACVVCGLPPDHDYHDPRPGGADHPRYDHHQLMAAYEKGRADEREACACWLETRAKSGMAGPVAAYELDKCARLLREQTP